MRRSWIIWLVGVVVIGVAIAGGLLCTRALWHEKPPEDKYEFQISYIEDGIRQYGSGLPPSVLAGRKKALSLLKTREVTTRPQTLGAVVQLTDANEARLWIEWVESDLDFQGIRFRETDLSSGQVVVEDYPVFADCSEAWRRQHWTGPWRSMDSLPVQFRTSPSQRKHAEKWERWARNPSSEAFPPAPIWIRMPSREWGVEVAVYDAAGQVGAPVPVESQGMAETGLRTAEQGVGGSEDSHPWASLCQVGSGPPPP